MTVAEAQTVAAVLEEKEVEEGGGDGGRQGRGSGTGVQNNQESRRKYWATRSSIHSNELRTKGISMKIKCLFLMLYCNQA